MRKIKGKCRTCLGCNKLDEIGFKGVRKCKYYKDGRNWKEILFYIMEIILLLALGYVVYVKISMVAGG